ncbi:hypothetical protein F4778DRAFT_780457 [Xylariomycetidae sp. FL2044]|nr:hypothetical protein F4778DRAFT_780457 [Xylariomycetidae sp. FL2044]
MSFGFSVGDFVAALQLIGRVTAALRECGGSGAEYRELMTELYELERALLAVKQLEGDHYEQHVEHMALRHVAAQCQQIIDAFCSRIDKYRGPFRREQGRGSRLGAALLKIEWDLCRKEDVLRFKTDVSAHAQSIQILLSAAQLRQTRYLCDRSARIRQAENGRDHPSDSINLFIFQMLCMIYAALTNIPRLVDRERPVIIFDALGRTAPFHLEFVRTLEAFKAVMTANFRGIPSGLRKIENGEFLIQDAATKRVINLLRLASMLRARPAGRDEHRVPLEIAAAGLPVPELRVVVSGGDDDDDDDDGAEATLLDQDLIDHQTFEQILEMDDDDDDDVGREFSRSLVEGFIESSHEMLKTLRDTM